MLVEDLDKTTHLISNDTYSLANSHEVDSGQLQNCLVTRVLLH